MIMLSELEIAQERVRVYNLTQSILSKEKAVMHKEACERWLEFMVNFYNEADFFLSDDKMKPMTKKIKDLKATIKLYVDNWI